MYLLAGTPNQFLYTLLYLTAAAKTLVFEIPTPHSFDFSIRTDNIEVLRLQEEIS